MFIYVVKSNDNLEKISEIFNISVSEIRRINALGENQILVVGQSLLINKNSINYKVKENDTIQKITKLFGVSINSLLKSNPKLSPPYSLNINEILLIRTPITKRTMNINGYCYPFSQKEDYLLPEQKYDFITLFSYSVLEDATLSKVNDNSFLNNIKNKNVKTFFTVSNTKPNGGFTTVIASKILSSKSLRQKLINNIMNVFNEKNIYDGVNIDFEYINKENADNLVSLIKELKIRLENNYLVSVCVAPKTRVDQEGTLYEGHDYKQLGQYADYVILMTYEWGYTFGPAMPVAPLINVRDVLIFAVTQIPSSKIFMGIPTYGYDFIEPFKKGRAAEAFPIDKAVDLAIKVKSSILFDNQSKTPYFIYYKEQQKHIVHFEDVRSLYYKVNLAFEFKVRGISLWVMSNPFIQMWNVFDEMIE